METVESVETAKTVKIVRTVETVKAMRACGENVKDNAFHSSICYVYQLMNVKTGGMIKVHNICELNEGVCFWLGWSHIPEICGLN